MSRHVLSELFNVLFEHLYSYESVKKIKRDDEWMMISVKYAVK